MLDTGMRSGRGIRERRGPPSGVGFRSGLRLRNRRRLRDGRGLDCGLGSAVVSGRDRGGGRHAHHEHLLGVVECDLDQSVAGRQLVARGSRALELRVRPRRVGVQRTHVVAQDTRVDGVEDGAGRTFCGCGRVGPRLHHEMHLDAGRRFDDDAVA
ncbi:hypothetical protein C5E05_07230 [Pseudoclavibacter sp. AY1H1]|nr:hypothetical protein C5E05_07230 [Pseudoclavibacter sp. AY1H1]